MTRRFRPCLISLSVLVTGSIALAQQAPCEVTMPNAFRLLERQAPGAAGIPYPAQTHIRVIAYGSVSQGTNRPIRARIDTAEGWIFVNPILLRGCPEGSIAQRPGDVAPTAPATQERPHEAPSPPTPAPACVPGSTQACLCVSGGSGVQSCASSGTGYEACVCAPPPPPPPPAREFVAEPLPESPAPSGPSRSGPSIDDLRQGMTNALTDSLARQVRTLIHPTGNGGSLGQSNVECSPQGCLATFTVLWTGGILGSAYQSNVRWAVGMDGGSGAALAGENSIIHADGAHIAAMSRYLSGVATRIMSR